MKFLFDFFPVILFFIAFKLYGIFVATGVAIVASIGQIAWLKVRGRRVDNMLWVSLGVIVVFGSATLLLHDETFIKWKPTVLYWLFAVTLVIAELFFHKNLIRAMMEKQIRLPDPTWRRLLTAWTGFFVAMGFLNLYVAFNFPTDTWVNFKLFGGMGLMFLFVVLQAFMLSKHVDSGEAK